MLLLVPIKDNNHHIDSIIIFDLHSLVDLQLYKPPESVAVSLFVRSYNSVIHIFNLSEGIQLDSYDYLGIIGTIGHIQVERLDINTAIDNWLDALLPIYREIADKYGFTRLDDMFKYILIKEQRNVDSHFENSIKDFNANGQASLDEFVDTNPFLQGEFNDNDKNMLRYTYERCSADLNSNLQ